MGLKLIEVTDVTTGFKTTVNMENVLMVTGTDQALIIFENSNMAVEESYQQIKGLLTQMID